jgi:hypothetical protein
MAGMIVGDSNTIIPSLIGHAFDSAMRPSIDGSGRFQGGRF